MGVGRGCGGRRWHGGPVGQAAESFGMLRDPLTGHTPCPAVSVEAGPRIGGDVWNVFTLPPGSCADCAPPEAQKGPCPESGRAVCSRFLPSLAPGRLTTAPIEYARATRVVVWRWSPAQEKNGPASPRGPKHSRRGAQALHARNPSWPMCQHLDRCTRYPGYIARMPDNSYAQFALFATRLHSTPVPARRLLLAWKACDDTLLTHAP
eukprot:365542-Chlamydomonas_euryale.AAC.4